MDNVYVKILLVALCLALLGGVFLPMVFKSNEVVDPAASQMEYVSDVIRSGGDDSSSKVCKGSDVIATIRQYRDDDTVAILVETNANPSGEYYGDSSHDDVSSDNLDYGDDSNEDDPSDDDYILRSAKFERSEDYYDNGTLRLITFEQQ
ncbi:MAG: hypothetical protein AB7G87_04910 [Clostridia bacterium]